MNKDRLDHSSFVEKHFLKAPLFQEIKAPDPFHSFLLISMLVGYICILVITFISMDMHANLILLVTAIFGGITVMTFIAHRYIFKRRRVQSLSSLLQHVFEGTRGASLITDNKGSGFHYNSKFLDLLASSNKEYDLINLSTLSRFFEGHPDAEFHLRHLNDQANRGMATKIELALEVGDEEKWFEISAQPIQGWAGFVFWQIKDNTEIRSLDSSIREEREKLIDFTDNAPVGFFSVDEEGRFVFVNATFARWVGEDIATLLRKGRLHTYMVDVPHNAEAYDVKSGGGMRQIAEVTMKGPAGGTFWAAINQTVVKDAEGRVRTRAVVNDLTSERTMRQALEASEDKFQRFFDEAPLGIALLNADLRLEDCNNAFEQMLGVVPDSLSDKSLEEFINEPDRRAVLQALKKLDKKERMKGPLEIQLVTTNKGPVAVQLYAQKFKENQNIVLHFIDMTQQKALEAQFVQSQKMQAIGQLAGGVAHDFNNLLTAMVGFCDLLLLRHKPGDPSFSDIMQIKQNANRAANLVRQLLAFSRQQTLTPKIHDVTDILTELSHLLRRLLGANVGLEVSHGQNLGFVKVDEGQMEQVLINLAVNARDAMQDQGGGNLIIRTFVYKNDDTLDLREDEMPPGEWVAVQVSDTGCGIPEELLSRILEPFFTTKDVGQGTGLGLATVYGIIRQTGGYLQVESEVGKGTSFTIYLPRIIEAEQQFTNKVADIDREAKDLTGTACILLVEDEDAVRTFSTRALTNKGYEVLAAENGDNALQVVAQNQDKTIDLLITDVVMPSMDGPTLAHRLRQEYPNLKIIFISGYTEDRLKDHMGNNISFLPKPFTLKQLAEKVKDVLDV